MKHTGFFDAIKKIRKKKKSIKKRVIIVLITIIAIAVIVINSVLSAGGVEFMGLLGYLITSMEEKEEEKKESAKIELSNTVCGCGNCKVEKEIKDNGGFTTGEFSGNNFDTEVYELSMKLAEATDSVPWLVYAKAFNEMGGSLFNQNLCYSNYKSIYADSTDLLDRGSGSSKGLTQILTPYVEDYAKIIRRNKTEFESIVKGLGKTYDEYKLSSCAGAVDIYSDRLYLPTQIGISYYKYKEQKKTFKNDLSKLSYTKELNDNEMKLATIFVFYGAWNKGNHLSVKNDEYLRIYISTLVKLLASDKADDVLDIARRTSPNNSHNNNVALKIADKYVTKNKTEVMNKIRSNSDVAFYSYSTNALVSGVMKYREKMKSNGVTLTGSILESTEVEVGKNGTLESGDKVDKIDIVGGVDGDKSKNVLKYEDENIDDNDKAINVNFTKECNEIGIIDKTSYGVKTKGSFVQGKLDGIGIHYYGSRKSANHNAGDEGEIIKNSGAHFVIDSKGNIAQYLSIDKASAATINDENSSKINIEVIHEDSREAAYSDEAYKSLVHLVAYLCYTKGFSLEFNFKENDKGNKYWDDSYVIRHYDATMNGVFRGKSCPINWSPNDGSGEAGPLMSDGGEVARVEGGNKRWIEFKIDVYNYIQLFKESPNFELNIVGDKEAKLLANRTYNYDNGEVLDNGSDMIDSDCTCVSKPCPYCDCHGVYGEDNADSEDESINTDVAYAGELTGSMTKSDFGYGSFKGNTWASSTLLDAAKTVMRKFISSGKDYTSIVKLDGFSSAIRYDCSGYTSAVLWYAGYRDILNYNSTGFETIDFEKKYGWKKIKNYTKLQPGDILVYKKNGAHHVEIYAGDNKVYNCGYYGYINWYNNDVDPVKCGRDAVTPGNKFKNEFSFAWRPVAPK